MNNTLHLFGRRTIYTDCDVITSENIVSVLSKALAVHMVNRAEIEYLYNYRRGIQPIINRIKSIRPEINNKIVENRADEIASFKTGYLVGEPVQYVSRKAVDDKSEIKTFNEYMRLENKAKSDKELADWFYTCGIAYRMGIPNKSNNTDESPFKIYTLDPRDTFVVRFSGLGKDVKMGVMGIRYETGAARWCCYTHNAYYEIESGRIVNFKPLYLGRIPIIEYSANLQKLGAFEIVLPMLDAINLTASNRMDGIEQFIQALMMFKGVDIKAEDYQTLKDQGAIKVPPDGDIKYLIQELNQQQTQVVVDYMYQTVLNICGVPNRNGGTSTSDTGTAVIMRDGWEAAEARAKDTETLFKASENDFIKLTVGISNILRGTTLRAIDIEPRLTRRNYENVQQKSQILTTMLANDKIHPKLAFEYCGMFVDPEHAYKMSMEYYEQNKAKMLKDIKQHIEGEQNNVKSEIDDNV